MSEKTYPINWQKFFSNLYSEAPLPWNKAGYGSPLSLKLRQKKVGEILERIRQNTDEEKLLCLDIGCGWGAMSIVAKEKGFDVVGLDNVREALKLELHKSSEGKKALEDKVQNIPDMQNILYTKVLGDALFLPFKEDTFDVAIAVEVLQYIPKIRKFFTEVKNVLKIGGYFLLVFPSSSSIFWMKKVGRSKLLLREVDKVRKVLWMCGFKVVSEDSITPFDILPSKISKLFCFKTAPLMPPIAFGCFTSE